MKWKVNSHLLPIKAHYFLFWGGLSGCLPFQLLIAQGLGISATAVGVLTSFYPFVPLIVKPAFGALADHLKQIKIIITATLLFMAIFFLATAFIPPINSVAVVPFSVLLCSRQGYELGMPLEVTDGCSYNLTSKSGLNIRGVCYSCDNPEHYLARDYSNITSNDLCCSDNATDVLFILDNYFKRTPKNLWFPVKDLIFSNSSNICSGDTQFYSCHLDYDLPSTDDCQTGNNLFVFTTFQFWLFVIFYICSRTAMSVVTSLSDTVCFQMLQGRYDLYGKQRMWGAFGWGLFSLLGGYFLSFSSHGDFSPGVYMTLVLILLDAFVVNKASVEASPKSGQILKDVGKLIRNIRILLFLFKVFCMGFLTGVTWNYLFWFLYTYGASKLLLSLVLVVQCFLGEVPSFFIAGKVVEKVGYDNSLTISFLAFGVRYFAYSFITNTWYVLPVELCQGLTFGLFYSTMAMYAKSIALPGTEASMQGLVGGTFEGLGVAVGGLVAGVTFDLVGGHLMFRYASFMAIASAVLHITSQLALKYLSNESNQELRHVQDDGDESNF